MNSKYTELQDEIIKDYVDNKLSYLEILKKYNLKSKQYLQEILHPYARSKSDSNKLAHKKYPQSFIHTEKTKDKIRQARLNYIKNNAEKTAWRKNESSLEQRFKSFLQDYGYTKRFLIEQEKSISKYRLDFAFLHEQLAVEIDGSQHWKNKDKHNSDLQKDAYLQSQNWTVIRIPETDMGNLELLKEKLDNILPQYPNHTETGLFKRDKKYIKKRIDNNPTEAQKEGYKKLRKVKNRPSLEELTKLKTYKTNVEIGKLYGVSETTIRNWIKQYKSSST